MEKISENENIKNCSIHNLVIYGISELIGLCMNFFDTQKQSKFAKMIGKSVKWTKRYKTAIFLKKKYKQFFAENARIGFNLLFIKKKTIMINNISIRFTYRNY